MMMEFDAVMDLVSVEETITKATANHPCDICHNVQLCQDESLACKVFVEYLPKGSNTRPFNANPELHYRYFVDAFIESTPDVEHKHFVWERDGYAGAFQCDADFDPRTVLDSRFRLYRVKGRQEAQALEAIKNVAEASKIENKIRYELIMLGEEFTTDELCVMVDVSRSVAAKILKRLSANKLITKGQSRPCTVSLSEKPVTTWRAN